MKKPVILIVILILTIISLAIIRTYIANNIATSGVVLGELEQKISFMQTENALLSEKLYSQSSLANISSKAAGEGFLESKASIVVNSSLPVALKR